MPGGREILGKSFLVLRRYSARWLEIEVYDELYLLIWDKERGAKAASSSDLSSAANRWTFALDGFAVREQLKTEICPI